MVTEKEFESIFKEEKEKMVSAAKKLLNPKMFDLARTEEIVDDTFIWVLNCSSYKEGFKTNEDARKILFAALRTTCNRAFFVRRAQMLREIKMSDKEKFEQFELAREIINNLRKS